MKISACVICLNEEQNIGRCLESLGWCDEIIVVDSGSTDRTQEIARKHTDQVFEQEWLGYAGQKEFCWGKASNDWIFWVDSDEAVTQELKSEIEARFATGDLPAGFETPRMVWYLGRWIRHGDWYPDRKLRLFKLSKSKIVSPLIHERVEVDGAVERFKNALEHYTYDDVAHHIRTSNTFTSLVARDMFGRGKKFKWLDLLFRPGWKFFRMYFLKAGFLDGFAGFASAAVSAFSNCEKYLKLRELERCADKKA
ncbi:MAG: glycosyltransferase family 2 protein [Pontiella sp.]